MNKSITKPAVSIGIPAYNEGRNIQKLLHSLLKQNIHNFTLKEVIVVSDGSTDNTVLEAESTGDTRVKVFNDVNRLGKPARINQIFESTDTDIVVLFDADIEIKSQNILETLLAQMINDEKIHAVFGSADILPPQNLVQKIVTVGWDMWEYLKKNTPNAELYNCQGTIRAFRRELYKKMKFPNASADDVFPFLYCKSHNFNMAFSPDATVYYSQPSTYMDYAKQMVRFHGSKRIQQDNFEKDFVEKYYVIKNIDRLKVLLRFSLKNPIKVALYIFFLLIPKIISVFNVRESVTPLWDIASTTKQH